jgi:hypothetical protein
MGSKNDNFTWYYDKPLPYYLTSEGEAALDTPEAEADTR